MKKHAPNDRYTFAKNLAEKAGKIMFRYFQTELSVELKSNITPLTIADTEINELVMGSIQKEFPDDTLISEEGSSQIINSEYKWICDPIDGTLPYTLGIPHSFFSIALYHYKKPVFGMLYNPMMNIFLEAEEGKPTLVNGKQTYVKKGLLSSGDTVGFVNHKSIRSNVDYSPIISHCIQNSIFVIAYVCNTFMSMLIANGKIKCAFITPAHIWDRAAVSIILRSAGGHMLDENGKNVDVFGDPTHIILTNGDCDKEAFNLLKKVVCK